MNATKKTIRFLLVITNVVLIIGYLQISREWDPREATDLELSQLGGDNNPYPNSYFKQRNPPLSACPTACYYNNGYDYRCLDTSLVQVTTSTPGAIYSYVSTPYCTPLQRYLSTNGTCLMLDGSWKPQDCTSTKTEYVDP